LNNSNIRQIQKERIGAFFILILNALFLALNEHKIEHKKAFFIPEEKLQLSYRTSLFSTRRYSNLGKNHFK
jgi:hypothetical protein